MPVILRDPSDLDSGVPGSSGAKLKRSVDGGSTWEPPTAWDPVGFHSYGAVLASLGCGLSPEDIRDIFYTGAPVMSTMTGAIGVTRVADFGGLDYNVFYLSWSPTRLAEGAQRELPSAVPRPSREGRNQQRRGPRPEAGKPRYGPTGRMTYAMAPNARSRQDSV